MFALAWRRLRLDPLKTIMTAFAIGAVIAVILVLEGFEQGLYAQLLRMVKNRGGDLIATQAGVSNFIAVRSTLPQLSRRDVEAVKGVLNAYPITAIGLIYEKEGKRTPVYLIVYDVLGGPVEIEEGQKIGGERDIVIDVSLARKHDLKVGDDFIISDFAFRIAGITRDEAAFMMPIAYVSYDGMLDLFFESEIAPDITTFPLLSFLLIEVDPAADREVVAREIEAAVPAVDVFTPEQLAARDVALGRLFFGPVMGLLVAIAYVIGLLVVGLIMYAEVNGELRSYGVLKALGFSHKRLAFAVLVQAVLFVAVSLPIGLLLGQGLAVLIHAFAPLYLIRIFEPFVFVRTILASIIFAVIGALIPLRSIRRVDPMIAFQGS